MRQKIQLELAFAAAATGEARSQAAQGTEALAATPGRESLTALGPLMEAIVERDNLKKALVQVRRNKGAPGVDGMTVDDLAPYLKDHWPAIRTRLLEGTYRPLPVRRGAGPQAPRGPRPPGTPPGPGPPFPPAGGEGRPAAARHPDGARPLYPAGGDAGAAGGLGPEFLRA